MASITTAVILAAGLGTRMLPATKAIPKEMLPIVDKPLIQYAVEEAVASGIERIVFVIAPGKEAIAEHFGSEGRVEAHVRAKGDADLLEQVQLPARLARYEYVTQESPRGIAHAVACARHLLEGAPFALVFPDDLILGKRPCLAQLAEAYDECQGSVLAVQEVSAAEIPSYGIVDPLGAGNPVRLRGLVEKPPAAEAPSSLGIVGRYIISPSIFAHIDGLRPGAAGELQITDALNSQAAAGECVCAFRYEGRRFDTGRPLGFLLASVAAALERPALRPELLERLAPLLEARPA
jgi:UTP--glucose-1-phosphate uridylyltransferase